MKKLALFLLFPFILFCQSSENKFIKGGFQDYYSLYQELGFTPPELETNHFYYDQLKELGLTHIVTYGDADALSNHNNLLKIIDNNLSRYAHETPPFAPYAYSYAEGNDTRNFAYEVGGVRAVANSVFDNYGFGSNFSNPPSRYGLIDCTNWSLINWNDLDGTHCVAHLISDPPSPSPVEIFNAKLIHQPFSHRPQNGGIQIDYTFAINARIRNLHSGLNDNDIIAVITLTETPVSWSPILFDRLPEKYYTGDTTDFIGTTPYTFNIYYGDLKNDYINYRPMTFSPIVKANGFTHYFELVVSSKYADFLVDNFSMYDSYYNNLFINGNIGIATQEIKNGLDNFYPNYNHNNYTHLYIDEPDPFMIRGLRTINGISNSYINRKINNSYRAFSEAEFKIASSFELSGSNTERPDYIMVDDYPFKVEPTTPNPWEVQRDLDRLINIQAYETSFKGMKANILFSQNFTDNTTDDDIPYYHVIQVAAGGGRYNNNVMKSDALRMPSAQEIFVQGYLAMCYGAKGLFYWQLRTFTDRSTWTAWWGLFDQQGNHFDGDYSNDQDLKDIEPNDRYTFVKTLNAEIDKISPSLMNLTWKNGFSLGKYGNVVPDYPGKYITSISSYLPNDLLVEDTPNYNIIELGIFRKTDIAYTSGNDLPEHFMVVNRRCETDGARDLEVDLHKQNSIYKNWGINEIGNNYKWTFDFIASADHSFRTYYEPGKGKLFRFAPVVLYGGDLTNDETISSPTTLKDEPLYIKENKTLTVSSTYNIYKDIIIEAYGSLHISTNGVLNFHDGAKLKVYGSFTNNGTPQNKKVLQFDGTGGVLIYNKVNLSNLSIRDAETGIHFRVAMNYDYGSVKNCEFINCAFGILGTGMDKILIQYNQFNNNTIAGINFLTSTNLWILSNSFLSCANGVFLSSCNGVEFRHNQVDHCTYGFKLATSTVNAGDNKIHHSLYNGIYVGESTLNIRGKLTLVPCFCCLIFDRERGYNWVYENYNVFDNKNGNGSEIYLYNSNLLADSGSNTIYDNRILMGIPTSTLMDGYFDTQPGAISLTHNEWYTPDNLLPGRFGNLNVQLFPTGIFPEPQNAEGCFYIQVVHSSNGPLEVDTLYVIEGGEGPNALNYLEELYQQEIDYRKEGNYSSSEIILKQIINIYLNADECTEAFDLLYTNYHDRGANREEFLLLGDYYTSLLVDCTNDKNVEFINQYIALCREQGERYSLAMEYFQSVIDNNPGTEKADFATLDLYSAALLDTTNYLGKSMIKVSSEDYVKTIQRIISKNINETQSPITKISPTEYNLYQNYPNPFNPSTTIQYDIPKTSRVNLTIYDVLGREITTLVNEVKEQGRYSVNFNASSLSSGVYIFQIKSDKYLAAKKMMIVK